MEQKPAGNWQAILLGAFSVLAILVLLAVSAIALAGGISDWKETRDIDLSLLPAFMTVSALLLASVLIGRAGWLAWRSARNKPDQPAHIPVFPVWAGILFFIGWVAAIILAALLVDRPLLQWFSLPFYLLAIGMPVYGLIRLGLGGLDLGSKLRAWSTLAGGMTISPLLSALAEGLALLIFLVPVGIYLGLNPERMSEMQAFLEKLKDISTQEELIPLLSPLFSNPLVLIAGLLFLAVVTPLVEETAKSLPVWLSWGRLDSPARGFALGALSGAGFGLMEGLLVSATGGSTWGATLAVRAASSAMHIITSGIVGWGIATARLQKRPMPVLGRYLLGMSIHGVWNASVVLMVFAGGMTLLSGSTFNIGASLIAVAGFCLLSLLILAAPFVLWGFNRKFQKSQSAAVIPENQEPPSSGNMVI